jgi:hypothetical protein
MKRWFAYGFIVPQEYVRNFIENEQNNLNKQYPTELDILGANNESSKGNLVSACTKLSLGETEYAPLTNLCSFINNNLIF